MRNLLLMMLVLLSIEVFVALFVYITIRKKATVKQLIYYECVCGATIYLLFLAYVTIISREKMTERYIEIIPFSDIISILRQKRYTDFEYIIANIFLLIPGGVIFEYILTYKKAPFFKIILLGTCLVLLVETLQYFSYKGIFDINDIIYNLLGYIVGVLIVRKLRKIIS